MSNRLLSPTVLIAALGYFVDLFDLSLFSVVRMASLRDLGVPSADTVRVGVTLFDWQMAGLLLGALVLGAAGDRYGRRPVLLASILLYSGATLANAFVTDLPVYAALRFVAGFGLAGELGAAITLVSEALPRELRSYGTMLVIAFGLSGAVAAGAVAAWLPWRAAYALGGVLGLALLLARFRLRESPLFQELPARSWGSLRLLAAPRRLGRLLACVAAGTPTWFTAGVLVVFAPELAGPLGVRGALAVGPALMSLYAGAALGDLLFGFASQRAASRKRVTLVGVLALAVLNLALLLGAAGTPTRYYALIFLAGVATGYWAVLLTLAAEQFGTNLRATTATLVPNLVRASAIPITLAFRALGGTVDGALAVGLACTALALVGLRGLDETFGRDLRFLEGVDAPR